MKTALITGGASGLGLMIAEKMTLNFDVFVCDKKYGYDVVSPSDKCISFVGRDEYEEVDIPKTLDILINCAGANSIAKLENATEKDWDRVVDANAKGIFMMTKFLLEKLRATNGTVLNIISNAATTPMRYSAAYNASKGAALTLTKQLARELSPQITVFAVSPNKLSGTEMSAKIDVDCAKVRDWSLEQAREYQLKGLMVEEETPAERVAEFVAWILSTKERHKYLSGCNIPYGATK